MCLFGIPSLSHGKPIQLLNIYLFFLFNSIAFLTYITSRNISDFRFFFNSWVFSWNDKHFFISHSKTLGYFVRKKKTITIESEKIAGFNYKKENRHLPEKIIIR